MFLFYVSINVHTNILQYIDYTCGFCVTLSLYISLGVACVRFFFRNRCVQCFIFHKWESTRKAMNQPCCCPAKK